MMEIDTDAIRDQLRRDDAVTLEFLENHIDEFQKNNGDLTDLWLGFLDEKVNEKLDALKVDAY
ncbi:hypothetical protein P5Z58_13665, partial [Limosilactobacillus mucosae]|nr:hypothetical protein [Limosilactobacillus mucosae]